MAKAKKQKKISLEIVASSPGRLRVKFPSEVTEVPEVEKILGLASEINEVSFSPLTNSLVVSYDENHSLEKLLKVFQSEFPHISFTICERKGLWRGPQTNVSSNVVQNVVRGANNKVNGNSRGFIDMTFLGPATLSMIGVARLVAMPVIPNWYDFIWYAYNMALHFRQPDANQNETAGESSKNEKSTRKRAKAKIK